MFLGVNDRTDEQFRALVRNSHDLTVVTDASGRPLYVSPSVTRILGYVPADFTSASRLDLIHPADSDAVIGALRLAQFSPATHPTAEFRARHRDGSWRWLDMVVNNLLADASIRGLVFNIRDISDRKQAELALAEATEEFRLAFENAPIGMSLTSIAPATEGCLLRVNQAMADMLGYTRAGLEGRTIGQLSHPDDRSADLAALIRFQSNRATTYSIDKRYRHADGHWVWVHLQVSMVARDEQPETGPRSYVISQMLDITERRAAEERLTFLALHDPLTGLANRRLLLDRLSVALARAARSGQGVAVFYLDLDHFKAVNDSLGHEQGDQLLRQVGSRLGALVRDTDTLARLGGDEFVLVADGLADSDEAEGIAVRIEQAFYRPFQLSDGVTISVTTSVGVATAGGGADVDPPTFLRQADAAMYQAKQNGRSCHRTFAGDPLPAPKIAAFSPAMTNKVVA